MLYDDCSYGKYIDETYLHNTLKAYSNFITGIFYGLVDWFVRFLLPGDVKL